MPERGDSIRSEAVLDASVLVKWFFSAGERHMGQALSLLSGYETGELQIVAPPLIWFELLSAATKRTDRSEAALDRVASALTALGVREVQPDLAHVARWAARGLTAYDAAYVAVAEAAGVPLITDDDQIVSVAPAIAQPLAEYRAG